MHRLDKDFDYAVGASIEGFEDSVKLTDTAPVIIIEGDEYLTSAIWTCGQNSCGTNPK